MSCVLSIGGGADGKRQGAGGRLREIKGIGGGSLGLRDRKVAREHQQSFLSF